MIEKIKIDPTFTYTNGVWNIDIDSLELPDNFHIVERKILNIPANIASGNHKHPRQEIFISSSPEVTFIWQDPAGSIRTESLIDRDGLYMIVVRPNTPHAIKNNSASSVMLLELADGLLENVEQIVLT